MKLQKIGSGRRRWRKAAVALTASVALAGCASGVDRWWGRDKLKHLGMATGLSAAATYTALEAGHSSDRAQGEGVALVLVLGAGKEAYDNSRPDNGWSWKDMTWNVVGALLGGALARSLHDDE
jgi:uncharacterized protein YfiM (DUF2279 family)